MLFMDESKFCIDFTDRRARVWRARNERFAPVCVAEHDRYGKGSVMVWAGISMQGKTDLHTIESGTLTAVRYVNEILDVYVRPYAGAIGADFILMDDNARSHRAHVTNQYLEDATIVRMDWPARSPDMTRSSMPGTCFRKQFLLAQSSQQRFHSSEQRYRRNGPDSLSNSSVGLSVASGGGVKVQLMLVDITLAIDTGLSNV